jgi:hypothetical protein
MRLRDWVALGAGILIFVLWTEYSYNQGVKAATQECEFGSEYDPSA